MIHIRRAKVAEALTPKGVVAEINKVLVDEPAWEFSPIRPTGQGGFISTLMYERIENLDETK